MEDYMGGTDPSEGQDEAAMQQQAPVLPMPQNQARPPESDEQRGTMPKPASKKIKLDGEEFEEGPSRLISGPIHSKRRQVDPNKPL